MMVNFVIFCITVTLTTGGGLIVYGVFHKNWIGAIVGFITLVLGFLTIFSFKEEYNSTTYIPAEPLAHNQTQTVFTTDRGTYTVDGLYPDGTYLLSVDGKDVLVVWQAVDGENG